MTRIFTRTTLAAAASIAGVLGVMTIGPHMIVGLSGQAPGKPRQ